MQNKRFIQSILRLASILGILIFLNLIASFYYGSIDLTEDKRFTHARAHTLNCLQDAEEHINAQIIKEAQDLDKSQSDMEAYESRVRLLLPHGPPTYICLLSLQSISLYGRHEHAGIFISST